MAERAATIDDVRKMIGKESAPVAVEIEKGMIKKFAEAIGDPNPLWQDEEYAKKSEYGGITAPPEIFVCSMLSGSGNRPDVPVTLERMLDGGGEWEFFLPARPGDLITSTTKLADAREREGKLGKMWFLSFETTHKNQRNEVVAISRGTLICY